MLLTAAPTTRSEMTNVVPPCGHFYLGGERAEVCIQGKGDVHNYGSSPFEQTVPTRHSSG
jgi:hypothetical protein